MTCNLGRAAVSGNRANGVNGVNYSGVKLPEFDRVISEMNTTGELDQLALR